MTQGYISRPEPGHRISPAAVEHRFGPMIFFLALVVILAVVLLVVH